MSLRIQTQVQWSQPESVLSLLTQGTLAPGRIETISIQHPVSIQLQVKCLEDPSVHILLMHSSASAALVSSGSMTFSVPSNHSRQTETKTQSDTHTQTHTQKIYTYVWWLNTDTYTGNKTQ